MKYLTLKQLEKMDACFESRDLFQAHFGNKAKVTLANVELMLGPGDSHTNWTSGDWLIEKLLRLTTPAIRKAFKKCAGDIDTYSNWKFDHRRTKAVYQLLKAVEL